MVMENRILETSCQLFSRYGIQQLRMDDLATHLGISKKTLYRFYPSRQALIEGVVARFSTSHRTDLLEVEHSQQDTLEQLAGYIRTLVTQYKKWSPLFFGDLSKHYPLLWDKIRKEIGQLVLDLLRKNLEKGIQEGVYRGSIHPSLLVTLWQQHIHNDFFYCQQLSNDYSKEEVFRQSIYLFLYGIIAPAHILQLEEMLGRIQHNAVNNPTNIQLDSARDLNQAFV